MKYMYIMGTIMYDYISGIRIKIGSNIDKMSNVFNLFEVLCLKQT